MSNALEDWLARLEQRTPEARVHLGLDRIQALLDRLPHARPSCPVITVGGTNGKGSVVALLEAIYQAAGYRTVAYTSPHLLSFVERIRIDGAAVEPEPLVAALQQVEDHRQGLDLTYFEHVTLAALIVAAAVRPEVILLEVGLGGRLDAVNAVDPDVAVITSIGLDHVEWLGTTRLAIGREKAGIARPGKPLILGEPDPPRGWLEEIDRRGARLQAVGRDFRWRRDGTRLRIEIDQHILSLPLPGLAGAWQAGNAASACMAVRALDRQLPVPVAAMAAGLKAAVLPGRLQQIPGAPEIWLDVAHNADAAAALATALALTPGPTVAVFTALVGKDVSAIGQALADRFERWLVPELGGDRSRPAAEVAAILQRLPVAGTVETVESVAGALASARADVESCARIVVFGSFRVVAEAWPFIHQRE